MHTGERYADTFLEILGKSLVKFLKVPFPLPCNMQLCQRSKELCGCKVSKMSLDLRIFRIEGTLPVIHSACCTKLDPCLSVQL